MWIWLSTDRSPDAVVWSGRPELELLPPTLGDDGFVEAFTRRRPVPALPHSRSCGGARAHRSWAESSARVDTPAAPDRPARPDRSARRDRPGPDRTARPDGSAWTAWSEQSDPGQWWD